MNNDTLHRYDRTGLEQFVAALFEKSGVSAEHAMITAAALVDADASGHHSHGIRRAPSYIARIAAGGTNPAPELSVDGDGSVAVVDGDNGLGQVVSDFALEIALKRARAHGVACVVARRSHHYGACGYWVRRVAEAGLIGVTTTNGGPVMAPPGGLTRSLSNDPVGIAVPTNSRGPLLLDMATTVAAGGRIDILAELGAEIPVGWALDAHGQPTTDPVAARAGLLLPIGAHKGFGLTIMFEVLAGVLAGAAVGSEIPNPPIPTEPMNIGHFFLVLDVARFMELTTFLSRVDVLIDQLESSARLPGIQRITLPGDPERHSLADSFANGIEIGSRTMADLEVLATKLAVLVRPTEHRHQHATAKTVFPGDNLP